jgi:putative CocE/NonD family hydrolase
MVAFSHWSALRLLFIVLWFAVFAWSASAEAATDRYGYITVADGTQLRYTVHLPAEQGSFPVALNYDGYCAGTGPLGCNDPDLAAQLLEAGYAVLGVSVRGTGCSTGTFDFRAPEESTDGAAVVEWAARQPWSTGRVGMFGDSFPGLVQPGIAALRPKGLAAIAPFQIVDDVYRDVGYPGGVFNAEFASFWALLDQPSSAAANPAFAASQDDPQCAVNYARQVAPNAPANIFVSGVQHPWFDDYWRSKSVDLAAEDIDVPVLGCASWQDDEVGSRAAYTLFPRIKKSLLWFIGTNGYHGMCDRGNTSLINDQLVAFFDRFVRGVDNGFQSTPRVQLWHEAHQDETNENLPSWVTTFGAWPPKTVARRLYLRDGGLLARVRPGSDEAPETYVSPAPSAGTEDGVVAGQRHTLWKLPVSPGGSLAWTTPALADDVEVLGPASANLWLSSTAVDTDLQVTITEVRPDGQETYVARGWLRASQRKLDRKLSSTTRPFQTHRQADSQLITPGSPVLARVEIFPFNHVFRAGSGIRMIVDTPSQTGGWNFAVRPTAGRNTIFHDAEHRSGLVLGLLPKGKATAPLPSCDTLLNQPCRTSAYPTPPGRMRVASH